jgi:hypothetical protein
MGERIDMGHFPFSNPHAARGGPEMQGGGSSPARSLRHGTHAVRTLEAVNVPPASDNEPVMLEWLRGFFGDRGPVPALVLRAHTSARAPRDVSVDAVWYPSGVRRAYRAKDAQGLCVLPWVKSARRVSLRVRAEGAEAELDVRLDEARAGRAFDLALR